MTPADALRTRLQLESAIRLWSGVRRLYHSPSHPKPQQWKLADAYYQEAIFELTALAGDDAVEAVQREICQHVRTACEALGPDKPKLCCHQGRDAPEGRLSVFRLWFCPARATWRVTWTSSDRHLHANYYCDAHAPESVPSKFAMKLQRLSEAGARE